MERGRAGRGLGISLLAGERMLGKAAVVLEASTRTDVQGKTGGLEKDTATGSGVKCYLEET